MKKRRVPTVFTIMIAIALCGCGQKAEAVTEAGEYIDLSEKTGIEHVYDTASDEKEIIELKEEQENEDKEKQTESLLDPDGTTLETRIRVPEGYERNPEPEGSFAEYLRAYPMHEDGYKVHYYDGGIKEYAAQAAVFDMHLGDRDLQQCADSVIRMYAEYLRDNGRSDEIAFHFVSGFLCDYRTWLAGNKVSVAGNNVSWTATAAREDTDETFEAYLNTVFSYASTISLKKEAEAVSLKEIQAGDIFIHAGSPGHVVMVADVCEKDGKKAFLLAQGYMPAQDFYVLTNELHADDPWYYEDEITYPFITPEYVFSEECLMRPGYL
ncbi:MAG: DUF4846 domain-containing protein [Lachnospiraceae bacterium]|nr:DUF4846 domain-containing protein [Lachnospiraceae bacterium]